MARSTTNTRGLSGSFLARSAMCARVSIIRARFQRSDFFQGFPDQIEELCIEAFRDAGLIEWQDDDVFTAVLGDRDPEIGGITVRWRKELCSSEKRVAQANRNARVCVGSGH